MSKPVLDQIVEQLACMNGDELLVMRTIAAGILGKGRSKYGPLNLAIDPRDFDREAAEEARDLLAYGAMKLVAAQARKDRG